MQMIEGDFKLSIMGCIDWNN